MSLNGHIFRATGLCDENYLVTGEFPSQSPVTRSLDVFFDLRLNKRLSKHSRRRWFETLSRPLWRQCNEYPALRWDMTYIVKKSRNTGMKWPVWTRFTIFL